MLAVAGCACLFAQTCMLHFSAKHHTYAPSAPNLLGAIRALADSFRIDQ